VIDYELPVDEAVNWPRVHADTDRDAGRRAPSPEVGAALAEAGLEPGRGHYGPTTLFGARAAAGCRATRRAAASSPGSTAAPEAAWRYGRAG
jgi:hypothetical protein